MQNLYVNKLLIVSVLETFDINFKMNCICEYIVFDIHIWFIIQLDFAELIIVQLSILNSEYKFFF